MAKLPITIYKMLKAKQDLYEKEELDLIEVYQTFESCGYKVTTANKWLLNWGIVGSLKFIPIKDDKNIGYRIKLGDFSELTRAERMDNNRVWLPVKETAQLRNGDGLESCGVIL